MYAVRAVVGGWVGGVGGGVCVGGDGGGVGVLGGSVCVGGVDLFTLETESDGTITITTQKYSPNTNVFFQTCWQSQLLI